MRLVAPEGTRVWPDGGWWHIEVSGVDVKSRFGSEVHAIRCAERLVRERDGEAQKKRTKFNVHGVR